MGMTIPPIELDLVLVRHGQTQWNAEHRYLGHTDLPLLPDSLEQLSRLKEQLDLQYSSSFWRVFCSDLLRCRETLAYIAPLYEKEAVYDQRLREMNFGAFEGCTYVQLKDNDLYRSWIDDPSKVTPPEGESWAEFDERLHSFLSELGQAAEDAFGRCVAKENKGEKITNRVLIVTHGGVIRNLLAQVVPDVTFYNAVAPSPGTVMVLKLRLQNGRWATIV